MKTWLYARYLTGALLAVFFFAFNSCNKDEDQAGPVCYPKNLYVDGEVVYKNEYDSQNRLFRQYLGNSTSEYFEYSYGNDRVVLNFIGVDTFGYYSDYPIIYELDENKRVIEETDAEGDVTYYDYDDNGYLIEEEYSNNDNSDYDYTVEYVWSNGLLINEIRTEDDGDVRTKVYEYSPEYKDIQPVNPGFKKGKQSKFHSTKITEKVNGVLNWTETFNYTFDEKGYITRAKMVYKYSSGTTFDLEYTMDYDCR